MTELGAGEYVVLVGTELVTVDHWDKIPEVFDNVIKWLPVVPPEPHTHEQHEAIETFQSRFQALLKKERNAGRNSNR